MTDNFSLMAHLIPRLTPQVENAATDALSHILNKSDSSMQALNDLLREGGFAIKPIVRVKTQVSYPDGSRPDIVGYDKNNMARLLVEAKFGASLSEGQARGYAQLLDQPGPAVLMFLAPERRLPTLWTAIEQQMRESSELKILDSTRGVKRAGVTWNWPNHTDVQLVSTSWLRLLDWMSVLETDDNVKSDINQLRGLAQREDARVFLPIHSEDLNTEFPRRVVGYNQLIDDAIEAKGVPEGWLDTKGLQATSRRWGYGRYFRYTDIARDMWFGINHELWAEEADTPLWLGVWQPTLINMHAISSTLGLRVSERQYDSRRSQWIPIHLRTGVDYDEVLDDIVAQLKRIGKIATADLNSRRPLSDLRTPTP